MSNPKKKLTWIQKMRQAIANKLKNTAGKVDYVAPKSSGRPKSNTKKNTTKKNTTKKKNEKTFWEKMNPNLNPLKDQTFGPVDLLKSPVTVPYRTSKWMWNNKKKTLLGALIAERLGSHAGWWGPGTQDPNTLDVGGTDQIPTNTTTPIENINQRNTTGNKDFSIERRGGSVRAYGGRVAPGMKMGGSLKKAKNGKFYR